MAARIVVALVAGACLAGLIYETRHQPRNLSPSALERTCQITNPGTHPLFDPPRSATVPCRALDEYMQTQWSI